MLRGIAGGSSGGGATLDANTFTRLQTITQGTANEGVIASTGYSLTGANAQSMVDLAGTWNTSGNPTALKIAITNTASGSTAKFLSLLMCNAGHVVTADAVMTTLYPHTQRGTDLLGVMIWKIRCAIAHVGGDRSIIHTVRGVGWMFSSPETRTALRFSAQELTALRVLVAQAPAHTRAAADMIRAILP